MAGVDAGERVPCPSCGETVLQKAMIPVLGEDGTGMRYLCVNCARALVVQGAEAAGPEPDEAADGADGETADVEPAEPSETAAEPAAPAEPAAQA
jgi:DNA-directed RNA polymerase subunit RPC12/RpoP